LVVDALIYFLIVAAVIFFLVVKPMNVLADRRRKGQEPEPEPQTDEAILLAEIRDLLRQQSRP
jgi:large conductance mechanosensitive channel